MTSIATDNNISELRRLEGNWLNMCNNNCDISDKLDKARKLIEFCKEREKLHDIIMIEEDYRLWRDAEMFEYLYGEK